MSGPPLLQSVVTLVGMFWIAFQLDPLQRERIVTALARAIEAQAAVTR